jgi:hypothetical protein
MRTFCNLRCIFKGFNKQKMPIQYSEQQHWYIESRLV